MQVDLPMPSFLLVSSRPQHIDVEAFSSGREAHE